jgi:hypothetical protein
LRKIKDAAAEAVEVRRGPAEARYRIDAPSSKPKRVKVIALDRPSEAVVKHLAQKWWNGATFSTASAFAGAPPAGSFSMQGWLSDLASRTKDLIDEVDTGDLVVMVATAGENPLAAALIGEACSLKRITTTGLILGGASACDEMLSKALGATDARHRQRRRLYPGLADRPARVIGLQARRLSRSADSHPNPRPEEGASQPGVENTIP